MSWLFGSSKKKEQPQVTIDPTPIEDGFCVIQNMAPQNPYPLYPNLNNSYQNAPLPYSPSPILPSASTSNINNFTTVPKPASFNNDTVIQHNQLESVPFRLAPYLQIDQNSTSSDDIKLNELKEKLVTVKQFLNNGELEYDFKLENSVIREARMVNGHYTY